VEKKWEREECRKTLIGLWGLADSGLRLPYDL
jgi:hypothetical protein